MSRSGQPPDLKKYMDKQLQIKLNANRVVVGTLRGFDQFMNLVVDNTVEMSSSERNDIGMVSEADYWLQSHDGVSLTDIWPAEETVVGWDDEVDTLLMSHVISTPRPQTPPSGTIGSPTAADPTQR